ncbi:hypothetical protein [Pseudomonas quasicaspiana]|uniref:hypothetical protein n=1 Tax=Pseudomonas quasicaspiana TaxID=2829821 RepID=UPI001E5591DB|nr:hypothetical protein [Pseudomonas quasicaspiana]MCD5974983.1 hypothetical protein [Pseudomonas quasicaspiana]
MIPAIVASAARAAAPMAKDLGKDLGANLAQGAGQQLASSGLDAVKNMMSGGPSGEPVSYASANENKPATY